MTLHSMELKQFYQIIDILSSNPDSVIAVGQIRKLDGLHPFSRKAITITSSNGFDNNNHHFNSVGNENDNRAFHYVNFLPNGESRILASDGIYNQNLTKIYSLTDDGNFSAQYGFRFINNNLGLAALRSGDLIQTTNGGYNWNVVTSIGYGVETNSQISSIGEIAYYGNTTSRTLFTRKLNTDLKTYFDDQSNSGSFSFDWINYSTPTNAYLRGGYSSLNCSDLINPGETNERIFYRWSDGFMKARHSIDTSNGKDFYIDVSGTIANYYKTKQISSTSEAISTIGQTKVHKDDWGAINQIHKSMNGGIFYTKSYNNGATYKREEIVNSTSSFSIADGNNNPALCETKWYGGLSSGYPVNKNVSACWEKYNSSNGMTEIKVAVRDFDYYGPQIDTVYSWNNWLDANYSDVFTSFNSSSSYSSNPKVFALAMDPVSNLGNPSTYFFIVPHLRPYSGGNKLLVTCRKGASSYADFELDSGDISDVSAIDSSKCSFGYLEINFVYRKGNQIIYRNTAFNYQSGFPIVKYNLEGPIDVSSGDGGFASRMTPDISLMNNVPVITYSANYNAWRLVEFENDETETIPVYRYPIVKVQRTGTNTWGNYVIYNSSNGQYNPDIEGSKTTFSYLLNYSLGNNQFKKVASVYQHSGYICQPNTYSGTDSRLVNNSYTGLYGNNLSMVTLSPQSNLYKLDKQDFIITNISSADRYDIDNLDGVVNLDTIKYSFRLGPIYIQDGLGGLEGGTFGNGSEQEDPILTSIEFNENLKSYPFLLNEDQALLIGACGTYFKDNGYYSIREIPYSVNLYNYSTGQLHRVLFQDTIHSADSIETEYLRGFYITNIPNGEDSFYVKLEPDQTFDFADYYINPIYDDPLGPVGPDNIPSNKMAVIFENEKIQNEISALPTEFKLSQNYPNPFNPITTISYDIPNDGSVTIVIYDITGKEMLTLVNEFKQAGKYSVSFSGNNFASGIYFYKIETGDFIQTKKMSLIK